MRLAHSFYYGCSISFHLFLFTVCSFVCLSHIKWIHLLVLAQSFHGNFAVLWSVARFIWFVRSFVRPFIHSVIVYTFGRVFTRRMTVRREPKNVELCTILVIASWSYSPHFTRTYFPLLSNPAFFGTLQAWYNNGFSTNLLLKQVKAKTMLRAEICRNKRQGYSDSLYSPPKYFTNWPHVLPESCFSWINELCFVAFFRYCAKYRHSSTHFVYYHTWTPRSLRYC